ncbi:MAG: Nif3-like dinuclear metal center hexameric protein [Verrucomicrobiota bacterium]
MNNSEMTIRAVIDSILERVPEKVGPGTVDSLKIGNAAQPVRGIVVTLMATRAVLQQAVDLGANFIVTHEPTFYHHLDATDWLETDSVSFAKKKWIEEHDLTIWRFHDGPHQLEPDGIDVGMALKLGWTADPARRKIFTVSSKTARDLAESCKQLLGISHVRVAGDLEAPCTRVGLRAGGQRRAVANRSFSPSRCRRRRLRRKPRMGNLRVRPRCRCDRKEKSPDRPRPRQQRGGWYGMDRNMAAFLPSDRNPAPLHPS